ncbi:MAG TPA: EamA family transporter [Acidobacteriaceae bacterium]|jgi:drug/metabolite transporter (DMT)-like permease|nr:EamA family transporter [Acidobacteriaceae bacterium]
MPARKLLAYAAIYVLWGGSFLAIREIVAVVPPFFAAGFRFAVAGGALLLWSRMGARTSLTHRQFLSAVTLAFLMFACLYAPLFWAETRIASGLAAVTSAMIPVWIFAGELFVLRTQRPTWLAVSGIALGFGGVALLALHSSGGAAHSSTLAILAALAGTITWSAGTLLSRRLTLPQPQKANAGWQMLLGGAMLLLLSTATREWRRLPPLPVLLSTRVVVSMAYLIVAASIIAYTAYVWLIAHEPPTRVSSYAYINPVFALIAGAALAGERLTPLQLVGAALVVAGVFATLRGRTAAASRAEMAKTPATR